VHVEAHLLDRVDNVEPGEGDVLESPSQAAVGSRIASGASMSEETLALVSTGVEQGLQSFMPVRSRISRAYWRWWRKNCCWRAKVVCWRSSGLEAVRTMSSM
jgi:hypothetical protein